MAKKQVLKKLTAKQRAFVRHYLVSGNASDAARKARYSKKTAGSIGEENLKKPAILFALVEGGKKNQTKYEIDKDNLVQHALKVREKTMEMLDVVTEVAGEEVTTIKMSDPMASLKANDQLAKLIGAYAPKEVAVTGFESLLDEL